MDPVSVIVLALIYAALRAPGEAGRAVRSDYRNRRGRWSARAEPWMNPRRGRGRGGRRIAGYDRGGRPYTRRDVGGRGARRPADPGWWRDPWAWRGPEGRARIARGVRPSAIRAGIVAGALGYTAVFGLAVAARGFTRGLRGGYRMGKLHYQGKRTMRTDPTTTVTPGAPDSPTDPDTEVVDAVIVEDPNIETPPGASASGGGAQPESEPRPEQMPLVPLELTENVTSVADVKNGPWLLIVRGPGVNRFNGSDSEGFAIWDPADLDRRLALIASIPGLSAEVTALPDPFEDTDPANGHGPAQPEPRDSRPDPAGHPDPLTKEQTVTETTNLATKNPPPAPVPVLAQYVPLGAASVGASMLMECANYDAHLHNLGFLLQQAQREYAAGELALHAASATRQRAEHDRAAAEQMALALASQDFGAEHVGHMAALGELLAGQVAAARAAESAARESLATNEQVIEVCMASAATFRRDHGQLAEAHAGAPHAAKTREAYQG